MGKRTRSKVNRKGGAQDIFMFGALAFAFAITCIVAFYVVGQVNPLLKSKIGSKPTNISINGTLDRWEQSTQSLDFALMGLVIGLILAIIISSLLVRLHPAFFFIMVIMLILAIIVAVPLSNSYEDIAAALAIGGSFTITTFIMSNLPLFVAVVGVTAIVISFVKMGSGGSRGL